MIRNKFFRITKTLFIKFSILYHLLPKELAIVLKKTFHIYKVLKIYQKLNHKTFISPSKIVTANLKINNCMFVLLNTHVFRRTKHAVLHLGMIGRILNTNWCKYFHSGRVGDEIFYI